MEARKKKNRNQRENDKRKLIGNSCSIYEKDSGTEDRATADCKRKRRACDAHAQTEQGELRTEGKGTMARGGKRAW